MARKSDEINLNEYYGGKNRHPKKRKHKKGFPLWWSKLKTRYKVLLCSVLALCIVLGSISFYAMHIMGKIQRDDDFNDLTSSELNIVNTIDKNVFNIALFGVDAREIGDFSGLSDSIMILSVNQSENKIKLVSIMRDSLVPIEKDGKTTYTKLNAAYSMGGAGLAVKTLNTLYSLDIAEYATVNFYGMRDIFDAVGGVEATITEDELSEKNSFSINAVIFELCRYTGDNYWDYDVTETGTQHLNGLQAVAYSRIRHGQNWNGKNDDFGRIERQRYMMKQLLDKALAMNLTDYPGLINKLVPYVKTSLDNAQMLSLAKFLSGKPQMVNLRIPGDDYIINADYRGTGSSTVYYNYAFAGKVVHAFLYESTEEKDFIAANGVDKTGWYGNNKGQNNGSSKPSPSQSASENSSSGSSSEQTPSQSSPEDSSGTSSGNSSSTQGQNSPSSSQSSSQDTPPMDGGGNDEIN